MNISIATENSLKRRNSQYYHYNAFWNWVSQNSSDFLYGQKIIVPNSFPHPARLGFKLFTGFTEPFPQKLRDWVFQLPDGGRYHSWEMENGEIILHYDQFDPERGLVPALKHLWYESTSGRAALTCVGLISLSAFIINQSKGGGNARK